MNAFHASAAPMTGPARPFTQPQIQAVLKISDVDIVKFFGNAWVGGDALDQAVNNPRKARFAAKTIIQRRLRPG
jgi:hypothetical protein